MQNVVLKTEHLTKSFTGMVANDDINLELRNREIVAIIGENGAGKSTFCKMITGIYQPDEGAIYLNGEQVHFKNTKESMTAGIGMVYQERNLVPMLTGAQNICLGANAVKGVFLKEKEIMQEAVKIREEVKLDIPLDIPIEKLGAGVQQLIEILRALYVRPKILILDEPTASLSESEIEPFLNFIKHLTELVDISILFISHKLEEVFEIADRIAVFTDGRNVLTAKTEELTQEDCIRAMLRNGEIEPVVIPEKNRDNMETIMSLQSVSYDGKEHQVPFETKKGEVIGWYGLVGAGRTELAESMMGLKRARFKGYVFHNEEITAPSPAKMISRGLILTPEKRANGMFSTLSLTDNICNLFINTRRLSNVFGFINFKACKELTDYVLKRNNVKYSSSNQAIMELSGGNIQKIIIGRAVEVENCRMIIVDEPTVGMDIGAKYEVYNRLRYLADQENKCILFISSELEELLGTCDKLYVFAEGNIIDCFYKEEFNKEIILKTAVKGVKVK